MLNVEQVAAICHEANRVYCQVLNDHSQLGWNYAPDWQRDSAINGVKFHLDHPNASASASHDSWVDEKVRDGWRRGDVKDPDRKLHPCLVLFDDLSLEQQAKDRLFKGIIDALRPIIKIQEETI